jgi:hypothetical protein
MKRRREHYYWFGVAPLLFAEPAGYEVVKSGWAWARLAKD